jgi:hypothetical protein
MDFHRIGSWHCSQQPCSQADHEEGFFLYTARSPARHSSRIRIKPFALNPRARVHPLFSNTLCIMRARNYIVSIPRRRRIPTYLSPLLPYLSHPAVRPGLITLSCVTYCCAPAKLIKTPPSESDRANKVTCLSAPNIYLRPSHFSYLKRDEQFRRFRSQQSNSIDHRYLHI